MKDATWLTQKPIAHRGLHDGRRIPENSLAAFEKAIAQGTPVECDVRMSADGAIIVFHDADLKRLTGDTRILAHTSHSAIADLSLYETQQKIPTLGEVLKLIDGRVPLLIEIKNNGRVGRLEESVRDLLDSYQGDYALQSFNPLSVLWFLQHAPYAVTGQIIQCSPSRQVRITLKRWALRMKWYMHKQYPDFISYEDKCFPHHYFASLHKKKKIPVLAWTIDSKEKQNMVNDYSDNIIFEKIEPPV